MYSVNLRIAIILVSLALFILLLAQCNHAAEPQTSNLKPQTFWNHGDSAQYVGIQTCRECHSDIYNTFIETGMGQSFGPATREKSAGDFDNQSHLTDSLLNFQYLVFWRNDSLFVSESRTGKGKLVKQGMLEYNEFKFVHLRYQHIDFVVGSGQHTNSHIFNEGGYLYQAPFTWYVQKGKLDFPPGFEDGHNSRFSRPIGLECMSCHNAMPTGFAAGSENKFDIVPNGIDCERCHGPGSLHVNRIKRGIAADTSKGPDPSIINPKRLTPKLQFEICQRCHLQGNTVLKLGKSFFDFRPGMHLDSVMEIYLPRYTNSDDKFIMASHVDRFTQSACYLKSEEKFVCTSCHNPHVSVQKTDPEIFNKKCMSCHTAAKTNHGCTADFAKMDVAEQNCVACHMPKSGSIDIPHVTVHDHYIRKPKAEKTTPLADEVFLGLKAINSKKPGQRSRIQAYLQQFEAFEPNPVYLDSAYALLKKTAVAEYRHEWVHYYYLKNEPSGIVRLISENGKEATWLAAFTTKSYNNRDAWAAYRIAEANRKFKDYNRALQFATRAVTLAPNHLEFRLKQSSLYALLPDWPEAEKGYRAVLAANPTIAEAWSDLGYVLLAQNFLAEAEKSINKAVALDPDYQQAKINLASVYLAQERYKEARKLLTEISAKDPTNARVKSALQYLDEQGL
jgi:tetratricopeptide (TPR) repeat protein